MGQKVHPYGFRLGFNKPWRSRWFSKQGYAQLLQEDLELKEGLRKQLKSAGISSIEVDRPGNKLRVTIRTSRPGIIIGRKGAEIEKLKQTAREEDQARSIHRHPGSTQAGARCPARVRIDRSAVGKARSVSPRDAQGRRFRAALRLQGNQGSCFGPSEWRGNRALANGICKGSCRCTRCAPTSTTASPKRTPPMV